MSAIENFEVELESLLKQVADFVGRAFHHNEKHVVIAAKPSEEVTATVTETPAPVTTVVAVPAIEPPAPAVDATPTEVQPTPVESTAVTQ